MRSVVEELRVADREMIARLSPGERVALALRLGDADLDALCRARRIDRATAIRLLERQRQTDRTPSACMSAMIG
ncbi:MAG TPA: hypothetical protein VHR45_01970 [Thermoanaerobaculia bacterium]|nr:hypothetical protein [Thermoanaerobaculia bacterium]